MICVECDRPATYSHIEDTVTTYSCERHRCQACTALDGASDSLMATLTALRDRLREQHLHGADALDAAIERLAAIQRVQGICEVTVENAHQFYEVWDEDPTAAQVPYGQWMVARHILRALDGERDG